MLMSFSSASEEKMKCCISSFSPRPSTYASCCCLIFCLFVYCAIFGMSDSSSINVMNNIHFFVFGMREKERGLSVNFRSVCWVKLLKLFRNFC